MPATFCISEAYVLIHGQNRKNNKKRTISLSKCKELYTNKRTFVDYITVTVSAYNLKNVTVAVTKCKDASLFSYGALRALLRSTEEGLFDGAIAYSVDGDNVCFRSSCLVESEKTKFTMFSALATELRLKYGVKDFLIRDETFSAKLVLHILSENAVLEEDF